MSRPRRPNCLNLKVYLSPALQALHSLPNACSKPSMADPLLPSRPVLPLELGRILSLAPAAVSGPGSNAYRCKFLSDLVWGPAYLPISSRKDCGLWHCTRNCKEILKFRVHPSTLFPPHAQPQLLTSVSRPMDPIPWARTSSVIRVRVPYVPPDMKTPSLKA